MSSDAMTACGFSVQALVQTLARKLESQASRDSLSMSVSLAR